MPGRLRPANLGHFDALRQLLAIFLIETPAASCGRAVAVDKDAEPPPLLPVKIGHQQPVGAVRVFLEFVAAADEHRGWQLVAVETVFLRVVDNPRLHRLVLDLEMDEPLCFRFVEHRTELLFIAAFIVDVETDVMHFVALGTQFVGVGAHRGEEQHELLLVMANVAAQLQVLGHEDADVRRRGQVMRREQLVAENDEQRVRTCHVDAPRACS